VSDHGEFIGEMYSTQVPGAKGGDNPMLEELHGLKNVDEQRAWFLKYVINNMRRLEGSRGCAPAGSRPRGVAPPASASGARTPVSPGADSAR
jgi:hypothetical protein